MIIYKLSTLKLKNLCLSYDNLLLCDGSGAQLQRIAFTYGLAKKYKLSHCRSTIVYIDSNPGDGLRNKDEKQSLITEINRLLVDPLENCDHFYHQEIRSKFTFLVTRFNLYWLWLFINTTINLNKDNPQLKINHTLISKNASPKYYLAYASKIKTNLNFVQWARIDDNFQIQAHFLAAKNSTSRMSERFIESKKIVKILELCRFNLPSWKILVHSDVDYTNREWKIVGDQTKETINYWREGGILDENGNFNLNPVILKDEFSENLVDKFATGISPLEVWKLMINARILICGKSSLSFMGALLNVAPKSVIFFPKGFIRCPKNWIDLDYNVEVEKLRVHKSAIKSIVSFIKENHENT
jgi:hypothetical protein